jgi:hypothetical protein
MNGILNEFSNTETSIVQPLLKLKAFAQQNNNQNLLEWANKELNGYDIKEVPEYRKVKNLNLQMDYLQIQNSFIKCTGVNVSKELLKAQLLKISKENEVKIFLDLVYSWDIVEGVSILENGYKGGIQLHFKEPLKVHYNIF